VYRLGHVGLHDDTAGSESTIDRWLGGCSLAWL